MGWERMEMVVPRLVKRVEKIDQMTRTQLPSLLAEQDRYSLPEEAVFSAPPIFVTNGQTIECLAVELPFRHKAVHQRDKPAGVRRLKEMRHLMHNDVFKTFRRLLRQLCIQTNMPCRGIATPPLRPHPLHKEAIDRRPHQWLPLGK